MFERFALIYAAKALNLTIFYSFSISKSAFKFLFVFILWVLVFLRAILAFTAILYDLYSILQTITAKSYFFVIKSEKLSISAKLFSIL